MYVCVSAVGMIDRLDLNTYIATPRPESVICYTNHARHGEVLVASQHATLNNRDEQRCVELSNELPSL